MLHLFKGRDPTTNDPIWFCLVRQNKRKRGGLPWGVVRHKKKGGFFSCVGFSLGTDFPLGMKISNYPTSWCEGSHPRSDFFLPLLPSEGATSQGFIPLSYRAWRAYKVEGLYIQTLQNIGFEFFWRFWSLFHYILGMLCYHYYRKFFRCTLTIQSNWMNFSFMCMVLLYLTPPETILLLSKRMILMEKLPAGLTTMLKLKWFYILHAIGTC